MKDVQYESVMEEKNVLMLDYNKLTGCKNTAKNNACVKLYELCTVPKGSAFHQLQQFRKLVPDLIKAYRELFEMLNASVEQIDRVNANSEINKNRRWSEKEENLLIELVVSDTPVLEISTIMGRSASAITSKVSKLVGMERISQKVAGKFFGTINGEEISGEIKGTVQK